MREIKRYNLVMISDLLILKWNIAWKTLMRMLSKLQTL